MTSSVRDLVMVAPEACVTVCSGIRTVAASAANCSTEAAEAPEATAVFTDSWTASACAVYDSARDWATCPAIDESTLVRMVMGRLLPEVMAAEKPWV
jgi:hypothetical protein